MHLVAVGLDVETVDNRIGGQRPSLSWRCRRGWTSPSGRSPRRGRAGASAALLAVVERDRPGLVRLVRSVSVTANATGSSSTGVMNPTRGNTDSPPTLIGRAATTPTNVAPDDDTPRTRPSGANSLVYRPPTPSAGAASNDTVDPSGSVAVPVTPEAATEASRLAPLVEASSTTGPSTVPASHSETPVPSQRYARPSVAPSPTTTATNRSGLDVAPTNVSPANRSSGGVAGPVDAPVGAAVAIATKPRAASDKPRISAVIGPPPSRSAARSSPTLRLDAWSTREEWVELGSEGVIEPLLSREAAAPRRADGPDAGA
jgi:hypothetical protein